MSDGIPFGASAPSFPGGMDPDQLAALLRALQDGQPGSAPAGDSPLVAALGGAPSMLGGQMPAPEMPAPQQEAPAPAPVQIPSMLGARPPVMPDVAQTDAPAPQVTGALPKPPAAAPPAEEAAPARPAPTPPVRPSDLSALGGAQPGSSFDPLTGQPVSGSPKPIAAAQGAPSPGGLDIGGVLKRLNQSGLADQLIAMGAGVLRGGNLSEGLGIGLQNALAIGQSSTKAQAEQAKLQRELAAQNQTAKIISQRLGLSLEDATALASNPNYVQGFLTSQFGAPQNFRVNADGSQSFVPGSQADPGYKAQEAAAGREPIAEAAARAGAVTKATNDATPDEAYTLGPGQTRFDASTNQPVATVAPKTDPTALQNDYEYAQKHDGYRGSFEDFATQRGNQTRAQTTFNNTVNPILAAAGERFSDSLKSATAAAETVRSIQNARAQIDAPGGIITGTAAEQQLALQKIGAAFGVADPRAIQNTETFRTQIKPIVLETVKGLGSGSGISNADRDFALEAVGGRITLDGGTIRRVLDITERANREKIERHNAMANGLLNGENGATYKPVASSLLVTQPDVVSRDPSPDPGAGAGPRAQAAPQGTETPAMGPLEQARAAIAAGADPNKVKTRLLKFGIDPKGL